MIIIINKTLTIIFFKVILGPATQNVLTVSGMNPAQSQPPIVFDGNNVRYLPQGATFIPMDESNKPALFPPPDYENLN